MKSYLLGLILGMGLFLPVADARTWTSADGTKTFVAELKSYNEEDGTVVVQKSNGKTLKFKQTILSEQDIEFLKTEGNQLPEKQEDSRKTGVNELPNTLPDTLPDPDGKEADMSKPVQVYILMGQSNMLGLGKVASLQNVAKTKYP